VINSGHTFGLHGAGERYSFMLHVGEWGYPAFYLSGFCFYAVFSAVWMGAFREWGMGGCLLGLV